MTCRLGNFLFHVFVICYSFLICKALGSSSSHEAAAGDLAMGDDGVKHNFGPGSFDDFDVDEMMLPVLRSFNALRKHRENLRKSLLLTHDDNDNDDEKNATHQRSNEREKGAGKSSRLRSLFNLKRKMLKKKLSSNDIY